MADERTFYEEDGNEISEAVTYLMEHPGMARMDANLEGGKTAKIYWVGAVLRIDIEGLK